MGNSDEFKGDLAEAKDQGPAECCRYHRTAYEWLIEEVEHLTAALEEIAGMDEGRAEWGAAFTASKALGRETKP